MKVPAKAKVRIMPKFLKKFSWDPNTELSIVVGWRNAEGQTDLFELIARIENDGGKEDVEEDG